MEENNENVIMELTADIVSSFVRNNRVESTSLPELINATFTALSAASSGSQEPAPAEKQKPAVSIKKSITPDYLVSLEDGRKYKSLKRHLRTAYNLTPDEYRTKWNLPKDYPMVAPSYAASRSALAKSIGLGRDGGNKTAIRPSGRTLATNASDAKRGPKPE